jgi:hypothetical protein
MAQSQHMTVTSEHSITGKDEKVVLKLNTFVECGIPLTLGCMAIITEKLIPVTTSRWGLKVFPLNIRIFS